MYTGAESQLLIAIIAGCGSVLGVSLALNSYFIRAAFRELVQLRDRDRQREVQVARVETRVDALERNRAAAPPAPIGGRHARA
jgi:hypothetical protein